MKPDCLSPEQWSAAISMMSNGIRPLARRMGRGFLCCGNCRKREGLTARLVENYLNQGWPKCCEGTIAGGTMNYYANQQDYERELAAIGGR